MKKKRIRKDDDGDEDNEVPMKKKKKQSPGRPKRVDKIENNTIEKYFVQTFGATLLKKCSAERDGVRKGASPNQAACPLPVPQVNAGADNSDEDLFESESEAQAEKPVSCPRSKSPKKIPKQAGKGIAKQIKVYAEQ